MEPQKQKSFFDNVMPTLEQPVFTATLKRGNDSSYEFGTINEEKFVGPLNFVTIDPSQGWWQFDSPGVQIGDQFISTTEAPSIAGLCTCFSPMPSP